MKFKLFLIGALRGAKSLPALAVLAFATTIGVLGFGLLFALLLSAF